MMAEEAHMAGLAACPRCHAEVRPDRREAHAQWHADQESALAELVNRVERLEQTAARAGNVWSSVTAA